MAFDTVLTLPWLARVEPAGTTRASASSGATSFRASAGLALAGSELNAAVLGSGLAVPGGCNTITATFKFTINSFHSNAWVIPGPGYAFSQVGIDFFGFRSGPGGMDSRAQRMILSTSVAPLTWVSVQNGGNAFRFDFTWMLPTPTVSGEAFQFLMRVFAHAAGGGFIAGAGADVRGSLSLIRVIGT